MRCRSPRHTTSRADEGGTETASTWTGEENRAGGEREQAGKDGRHSNRTSLKRGEDVACDGSGRERKPCRIEGPLPSAASGGSLADRSRAIPVLAVVLVDDAMGSPGAREVIVAGGGEPPRLPHKAQRGEAGQPLKPLSRIGRQVQLAFLRDARSRRSLAPRIRSKQACESEPVVLLQEADVPNARRKQALALPLPLAGLQAGALPPPGVKGATTPKFSLTAEVGRISRARPDRMPHSRGASATHQVTSGARPHPQAGQQTCQGEQMKPVCVHWCYYRERLCYLPCRRPAYAHWDSRRG
jgi:hypothetical protein